MLYSLLPLASFLSSTLPAIILLFLPLASLFLLPLVFVFMFVGELTSVSESLFVFDEVALLVALFEIVGLFVLVIPGKRICPEVADIAIRLSSCPLLFLIPLSWCCFSFLG